MVLEALRHELRIQPIDLSAEKRRVLDSLYGTAWFHTSQQHPVQDGFLTFPLAAGAPLCLDPQRIIPDRLQALTNQQQSEERQAEIADDLPSWRSVGQMHGNLPVELYLNPRLTTLDSPRLPGITVREQESGFTTVLQIGTLELLISSVRPDQLHDLKSFMPKDIVWESACNIGMKRTTTTDANSKVRHPDIAEATFFREFKLGLQQLVALGFSTAIGLPSDSRRARIYQTMGMDLVWNEVGEDFTVLRLDDLPPRLRR